MPSAWPGSVGGRQAHRSQPRPARSPAPRPLTTPRPVSRSTSLPVRDRRQPELPQGPLLVLRCWRRRRSHRRCRASARQATARAREDQARCQGLLVRRSWTEEKRRAAPLRPGRPRELPPPRSTDRIRTLRRIQSAGQGDDRRKIAVGPWPWRPALQGRWRDRRETRSWVARHLVPLAAAQIWPDGARSTLGAMVRAVPGLADCRRGRAGRPVGRSEPLSVPHPHPRRPTRWRHPGQGASHLQRAWPRREALRASNPAAPPARRRTSAGARQPGQAWCAGSWEAERSQRPVPASSEAAAPSSGARTPMKESRHLRQGARRSSVAPAPQAGAERRLPAARR